MPASEPLADAPVVGGERAEPDLLASRWKAVARIVAMVAVITIHTAGFNAAADGARRSAGGRLAILFNSTALFSVPMFVMVSGSLLLDPARYRPAGFLRRRVVRLIPALVFWHLAYWLFAVQYLDREISPHDALEYALSGQLYTGLYYFWIALGLSMLTPLLVPFIRDGHLLPYAVVFTAAPPILTVALGRLRPEETLWVHTAWTWWFFYVGYFLAGWWLSQVPLTRRRVGVAAAVAAVTLPFLYAGWLNPGAGTLIAALAPASYYSFGVHVFAASLFVSIRAVFGTDLVVRSRPERERWVPTTVLRTLGDATLGVFGLHLMLIELSLELPWIGGEHVASSSIQLVARISFIVVVTFAVVVPLRRAPVLGRVL